MGFLSFAVEFRSVLAPAIVGASVVFLLLLLLTRVVSRWEQTRRLLYRYVLGRRAFDYPTIIRRHLERFNKVQERRELYPALVTTVVDAIGAEGVALILQNGDGKFHVKAYEGTEPLAFDLAEAGRFFRVAEKRRKVVTRSELVHNRSWASVKNEGLRFCVQFGAEACVPLFIDQRLMGMMSLGSRREGSYDTETCEVLQMLATQFSIALHNVQLYEELVAQNNHLKATEKLKSEILANVSHELRTPLTSIIGMAEMLMEEADGPITEEQREHLGLIAQGGARLLEAVSSMLDLSRIQSHQMCLAKHKFDLGRVVGETVQNLDPLPETKVEVAMSREVTGVYGDERQIRLVVRHLLDNAVKFTKRGKISIGAEKTGEMLRICVEDTGIGIPRDRQKEIFNSFTQADGSITREHEGLGLGLAIARRIVELHGGRLWLMSREGKGSRFFFTLPLKPAA